MFVRFSSRILVRDSVDNDLDDASSLILFSFSFLDGGRGSGDNDEFLREFASVSERDGLLMLRLRLRDGELL
jgi:hypothetical protein